MRAAKRDDLPANGSADRTRQYRLRILSCLERCEEMDLAQQKKMNERMKTLADPKVQATLAEWVNGNWWEQAKSRLTDALFISYACLILPANFIIAAEEACIACETGIPLQTVEGNIIAHVHGDIESADGLDESRGQSFISKPHSWRLKTYIDQAREWTSWDDERCKALATMSAGDDLQDLTKKLAAMAMDQRRQTIAARDSGSLQHGSVTVTPAPAVAGAIPRPRPQAVNDLLN